MGIATGMRITAVSIAVLLVAASADAQPCGDPNQNGQVTVSDGVLVLRSAAQLPATCPPERCDMNLDGRTTVTDGVLALRVAAEIQTEFACSAAQSQSFFGSLQKTLGSGQTAPAAARARVAGSTIPCSGGGFKEDDGFTLFFSACREGDFITDGTIDFSDIDGGVSLFFDTTDFVVSTGEVFGTFGALDYTFGDVTIVNGFLEHSSSIVGEYSDEFFDVVLDADFFVVAGRVETVIFSGQGLFANVNQVTTNFYSPSLAQIFVAYVNDEFDVFMIGDNLCEPCSGGCSNPTLTCLSCVDGCGQTPARCAPDFFFLDCADGTFGPSGLCAPCTSSSECNTGENLSCFPCDRDCTGSTDRCASSIAFVECEDGRF
jgi:hypothetical protein